MNFVYRSFHNSFHSAGRQVPFVIYIISHLVGQRRRNSKNYEICIDEIYNLLHGFFLRAHLANLLQQISLNTWNNLKHLLYYIIINKLSQ